MRRKVVKMTALAACLALVFTPVLSADRGIDRQGDRTKQGITARGASDSVAFQDTFDDMTRAITHTSRVGAMSSRASKAEMLLAKSMQQEGVEAISTLNRVLGMGLVSSPATDKMLAAVNQRLGDLYEGTPSKQVNLFARALQYTADPGMRAQLQGRIAELGGDAFTLAFNPTSSATTRDAGPDDTCDGATAALASETMSVTPAGDHNWRFFDVPGPDGNLVRIETVSDTPGSFDDDTDLTLYGGCVGGVPVDFIAFNDDGVGVNAPFMSRIDTDCLAPGTYYIEVGGFADVSTPDDFDLEVEVVGTCAVPQPDDYEDDNNRADGAQIGHPTSTPTNSNGWGRAKKEIQSRSIFPNADVDHAQFKLTRNELTRMGTSVTYPTFFNDFTAVNDNLGDHLDTVMGLFYQEEHFYGGRCNEPDTGFGTHCDSDADCPVLPNPLPNFPDCIPIFLFNSPFDGFLSPDGTQNHINDLANNDDRGGGDFGSELLICLPRSQPHSDSASVNGDWVVRIDPFSTADIFDYELQVKNEVPCNFEKEPNNALDDPNELVLGTQINGLFDYSESVPFQDADVLSFTLESAARVVMETDGYDSLAVDTGLQLIVGPDDSDPPLYFLVFQDDDGGSGFLSKIDLVLPPPNDLLGNTVRTPTYLLNVTSFFLNPNYPWTLNSELLPVPIVETEPNNDCASANPVSVGDTVIGEIFPTCDFDSYKLSLTANTFIELETDGAMDTTMRLKDCADDSVLACDDDGGPGLLSRIEGCLPPGDYCIQVRAFSGFATGGYQLGISGTEGCTPTNPPDITGDGLFVCADYDTCP